MQEYDTINEKIKNRINSIYQQSADIENFDTLKEIIDFLYNYFLKLDNNKIKEMLSKEQNIEDMEDYIVNSIIEDEPNLTIIDTFYDELVRPTVELIIEEIYKKFQNFLGNCDMDFLEKMIENNNELEVISTPDEYEQSLEYILRNVDITFAKKLLYKYGEIGYLKRISDDIFKKMDIEDYLLILTHNSFSSFPLEKRKIIIEKVGLVKTLNILNNKDNNYLIYEAVSNITEDEFNNIIYNNLYYGIELCPGVVKNKDYINRLIKIGYINIILALGDEEITDDMLNILDNTDNYELNYNRRYIKSDKLINHITENYGHAKLFKLIALDKLSLEIMLRCLMQNNYRSSDLDFGDGLYEIFDNNYQKILPYITATPTNILPSSSISLNERGIQYLIDRNFDFSNAYLKEEELKILLNSNYSKSIAAIIDNHNWATKLNDFDMAFSHGYRLNPKTYIHDNFINECLVKIYLEERPDKKEFTEQLIVPYFYQKYPEVVSIYLKNAGFDSIYDFVEAKGISDEFSEFLLFNIYNYEDIDYLAKKYQNNNKVLSYLYAYQYMNISSCVINSDNFDEYFSESGPTRKLIDRIVFETYNIIGSIVDNNYTEEEIEIIKAYQKFMIEVTGINPKKNYHCISPNKYLGDICNYEVKNLSKYFDKNGPKKELLEKLLFSDDFYDIIPELKQYYNWDNSDSILSYINFNISPILKNIIKDRSSVDTFFNESGPKKELCDLGLFNFTLFCRLFMNDTYLDYYKDDQSILSYIKYVRKNCFIPKTMITNINDIHTYFSETGPKRKLYDDTLCNEKLLFRMFKDDSYKAYYNESELLSINSYLNFVKKYGFILKNKVLQSNDIFTYFDESGYTNNLKELFRNDPKGTSILLSDLAHDNTILANIDNNFVNMFEFYLIEKYFSKKDNKEEQYRYLLETIGPNILFNFENNNIQKIIDYDKSELEKLFAIFRDDTSFISSQDTYNNFIISLTNYAFKKDNPITVEIFTHFNSAIDRISWKDLNEYLDGGVISDKTSKLNVYVKSILLELNSEITSEELKEAIRACKRLNEEPLRKICRKYLEKNEKNYFMKKKDTILLGFGINEIDYRDDGSKKLTNYISRNIEYDDFIELLTIITNDNNNSSDSQKNYLLTQESISDGYLSKVFKESIKHQTFATNIRQDNLEKLKNISKEQFLTIIKIINNNGVPDTSLQQQIRELGPLYSTFKKVIGEISKYYINNNLVEKKLLKSLDLSGPPIIPLSNYNLLQILSELDIECFMKYANDNPKILENLKKIIKNYGLGCLPESIANTFQDKYEVELPGGINNIGTFITKYEQLLKNKQRILRLSGEDVELEDIHFSFPEVVEQISLVNSETYELRRLLGKSEYYDFAANKGNNRANFIRNKREKVLGDIVNYLYTLGTVTIPTHDMIIESKKTNQKINFIVGNRTNASNICHGERTDACMRVGGVGEGLFLKCLTDKNWFHIRIEDPITHDYISRVSGFRNGNTVYLNQLREVPTGSKYTNKDLQEYIKIYAETLIEETKNTKYPIENVFINIEYAMKGAENMGPIYHFGKKIQEEYSLSDVKDLMLRDAKEDDIWTDVKRDAVLLATTEEGKKTKEGYVPLKNGPENTMIYKATRDKIYGIEYPDKNISKHHFVSVEQKKLAEKINRVHAMKEKLLGKNYMQDIFDEIGKETKIKDGYASADWYVYLDEYNDIHTDYISEIEKEEENIPYHQAEEAKEEMEYYKEILINRYNLSKEVIYAV